MIPYKNTKMSNDHMTALYIEVVAWQWHNWMEAGLWNYTLPSSE